MAALGCGVLVLGAAARVQAQGAVGTGPLTAPLADAEPTSGVLRAGPVRLAPGITVSQMGTDSNVFNEAVDPKDDFVIAAIPDVSFFTRLRFVKVSAYGGADLNYFRTYTGERSAGYIGRARVDLLLGRLFPFVGYGQNRRRERPNSEIDTRANQVQTEKSAGLGFELSPTSAIYVSAIRSTTEFQNAVQSDVDLGQSLNRTSEDFNGGVRTALTPLSTLTLRGGLKRDLFVAVPERNADARYFDASFNFVPQAVINGTATVGYTDFQPTDPGVKPYRGLTTSVALTYPLLEIGRLHFVALRSVEYSFDAAEAYYIQMSYMLNYTQRLVGDVDANVQGSRAFFDYGSTATTPERRDQLDLLLGGVGYNLRNRTRVALNYEYSRRRSPALPDRNYERRRVFLSWAYAF